MGDASPLYNQHFMGSCPAHASSGHCGLSGIRFFSPGFVLMRKFLCTTNRYLDFNLYTIGRFHAPTADHNFDGTADGYSLYELKAIAYVLTARHCKWSIQVPQKRDPKLFTI